MQGIQGRGPGIGSKYLVPRLTQMTAQQFQILGSIVYRQNRARCYAAQCCGGSDAVFGGGGRNGLEQLLQRCLYRLLLTGKGFPQ